MRNTLLKILAVASLGLVAGETQAQFNSLYYNNYRKRPTLRLKLLQRMDIGFHAGFGKAFFDQKVGMIRPRWDENSQSNVNVLYTDENTFKLKGSSFGGNIGFYLPVGYVARFTRFALNVEAYVTSSTYDIQDYKIFGVPASAPLDKITCLSIAVPLGFDIKWGGQSTLSRHSWASTGIGGGIAPTYYMVTPTTTGPNTQELTVRPYIKAEFGFLTGIFWKVKGMVFFNKVTPGHWVTGNPEAITQTEPFVDQTMRLNRFTYSLALSFNIGSLNWGRDW